MMMAMAVMMRWKPGESGSNEEGEGEGWRWARGSPQVGWWARGGLGTTASDWEVQTASSKYPSVGCVAYSVP